MHRREFLRGVALAGIAAGGGRGLASSFAGGMQSSASGNKEGGPMIYRTLGRTGERVSELGLAGLPTGQPRLKINNTVKLVGPPTKGESNSLINSWNTNQGQNKSQMAKARKDAIV